MGQHLEVYLLSLAAACVRTHHEYGVGWGGSGMPDTTVEPSGGAVGLIQRNTDGGRCLLENPSKMPTKAALLLLLLYPAAQVLWLGSHVVVFSACCTVKEVLYGSRVPHAARVLLLRIYSCSIS